MSSFLFSSISLLKVSSSSSILLITYFLSESPNFNLSSDSTFCFPNLFSYLGESNFSFDLILYTSASNTPISSTTFPFPPFPDSVLPWLFFGSLTLADLGVYLYLHFSKLIVSHISSFLFSSFSSRNYLYNKSISSYALSFVYFGDYFGL